MAEEKVVEQVANHIEEVANVTRKIDTRAIGFFAGGVGVGIAIGFFFGFRYNREKIKAEAFKESREETDKIREHYHQKTMAAQPKPSVEEIIQERGYSSPHLEREPERLLRPPVPVSPPRPKRTADGEKDKNDGWSYPFELSQRSSERPYIIHQDEFATNESDFQQVTYNYYSEDDILVDEHDMVIENRDNLVGENNLSRWGHGTDDINILYIRNPRLEIEFELCRNPGSFEEEVIGLDSHDDEPT